MVGSLQFQARATAVVRLHVVALAVVVLAALVSSAAAAARTEEALTTYFLDVTTPEVTVSADQPWECATRVQLRLTEDSVPARMPVVTVSTQTGMVHTVVNTVEWLKVRHTVQACDGSSSWALLGCFFACTRSLSLPPTLTSPNHSAYFVCVRLWHVSMQRNAAAHARVKQFVDRNPTTEYRYPVSGACTNAWGASAWLQLVKRAGWTASAGV